MKRAASFLSPIAAGLFAVTLSSCQVYNSSSQDETRYSGGDAFSVLANRCSACHAFASQSAEDLEAQGLIVPGSPQTSPLLLRLNGSGYGGAEDMPPSGTIPDSEIQLLIQWVTDL